MDLKINSHREAAGLFAQALVSQMNPEQVASYKREMWHDAVGRYYANYTGSNYIFDLAEVPMESVLDAVDVAVSAAKKELDNV